MCPIGSFAHTIRYGENLWSISRIYNVTVNSIMTINPGINPYNLRIGQVICVPR